jgi:hypothetical protein
MKEKMKALLIKILMVKEIEGDPIDLSPGLKISRVVNEVGRNLSFNEISQNILDQKKLIK